MSEIVKAQYVYFTVPKSDIKLYHRLLSMIADYGEARLTDCTPDCTKNNQIAVNLYNMFHAAIAAKHTGRLSLYNALITYIDATLDCLYKGTETIPDFIYESDLDGNVIIDIENNILITEEGQYTIGEYVPARIPSRIYYELQIDEFLYKTVSAMGGVLQPTLNYTHKKIIEYEDGGDPDILDDNDNVIITFNSNSVNVNPTTGSVTIPSSTNPVTHNAGTVYVNIQTKEYEDGEEIATDSSQYTIQQTGYVEPTVETISWYEITINLFTYPIAESSGGVLSPTLSYTQKKITTNLDGTDRHEEIDNENVVITYESTNLNINSNSGVVIVESSTLTTTHNLGYARVKIDTKDYETGVQPASASITYLIRQKGYVEANELIHSCITITIQDAENIINGLLPIQDFINTNNIYSNIQNIVNDYKLDNSNPNDTSDEITIGAPDSRFFIQVFLLSNKNHNVINYFKELGVEEKDDIRTQRFRPDNTNTIYEIENYSYYTKSYRLIAILRSSPINNRILIQQNNG